MGTKWSTKVKDELGTLLMRAVNALGGKKPNAEIAKQAIRRAKEVLDQIEDEKDA